MNDQGAQRRRRAAADAWLYPGNNEMYMPAGALSISLGASDAERLRHAKVNGVRCAASPACRSTRARARLATARRTKPRGTRGGVSGATALFTTRRELARDENDFARKAHLTAGCSRRRRSCCCNRSRNVANLTLSGRCTVRARWRATRPGCSAHRRIYTHLALESLTVSLAGRDWRCARGIERSAYSVLRRARLTRAPKRFR